MNQKMCHFLICLGLLSGLVGCTPSLRKAEEYIEKGKYSQAQNALQKVLSSDANNLNAQILLGHTYFYTEPLSVTIEHLKGIETKAPNNNTYKRVKEAIQKEFEMLDQILSGTPEEMKAYLKTQRPPFFLDRVRWAYALKAPSESERETLKEQITTPYLKEVLDTKTAKSDTETLERLLFEYPKSALRPLWYLEIIQNLPQDKNTQINSWLVKLKEEAQSKTLQAAVLQKQAKFNLEKNPVAAFNYYKTFLKNHPNHIQSRDTIYEIRNQLSKYLTPSDHEFLAESAMQNYMYQTAASELNQLNYQHPNDILKQANYSIKANYLPQARSMLQGITNAYPGSEQAGEAKVMLAYILRKNKQYTAALSQLREAKSQYGQYPKVLGNALWEEGLIQDILDKSSQRIGAFRQILDKTPDNENAPEALWHVIWDDYQKQDYEAVLARLEKHAALYKEHELESRFKYWQARCFEHLEKWDEAKSNYQSLSEGLLMNYYTHRAKERLRVLEKGGEDLFSTQKYNGFKRPSDQLPSYTTLFEDLLKDKNLDDVTLAEELLRLKEYSLYLDLSQYLDGEEHLYWRGLLLKNQKDFYGLITRYRYLAKDNNLFVPIAFPLAYFDRIESEAQKYQMNPFLVSGLIWQESQYKPDIKSWVGATGLMQIMPSTGTQIAKDMNLSSYELTDPNDNIKMGTWYLNFTHSKFDGNSLFAVASYNAGTGPVYRWEKDFKGLPLDALAESITYPETREYVKKVFTSYWIYQSLYGKS